MGAYHWLTYGDVDRKVGYLAAALRKIASDNAKVVLLFFLFLFFGLCFSYNLRKFVGYYFRGNSC